MRQTILTFALVPALSFAVIAAQPPDNTTVTVRITAHVAAGETTLSPGTYEIRLTQKGPTSLPGQPPDSQRWVEFVESDKVIAREIAEVLRDDDLPAEGASSRPVRDGTRVEMLKGGEFLRISIKRERERYLIHLPVKP
jgi:hypothetical protein